MNAVNFVVRFAASLTLLVLAAAGAARLAAADAAASYRAIGSFDLPGGVPGQAVRLDGPARRLYVSQGDRIAVLDADSGRAVGSVAPTPGVRGIEIAPGLGWGFTANAGDGTVTIFDLKSDAVVRVIPSTGREPSGVLYDPDTGRLFVSNRASGDLTVVDPVTGAVAATIPLGGALGQMACNRYGRLFVVAEDRSVIHVVDTRALEAQGDDPLAPGVQPTGIDMDRSGRRIFVACANGWLDVVDADNGFVFQVLKSGLGRGGVVFDRTKVRGGPGEAPWKGRILVATADGALTAARMNAFINYTYHDTSRAAADASTLAFDGSTNRVFVPTAGRVLILGR
jgi:YVTN family beta-propeller protein